MNQNILFTILFLSLWIVPTSASGWTSTCSITVHNGQSITCNGLTTKIQLPSAVTGHINKDGKLVLDYPVTNPQLVLNVNGFLIALGESETYQDDLNKTRITASGFTDQNSLAWEFSQYNPTANLNIEFWQQDLPNLQIRLLPQYTTIEYGKYEVMDIGIEIKNIGAIALNNVEVKYNFGNLTYATNKIEINSIGVNEIQTYNVTAIIPKEYGDHKITANASLTFLIDNPNVKNQYNKDFYFSNSAIITITPPQNRITITKVVTERLYKCANSTVVITVANGGMFDITNVKITDSVPDSFNSKNLSYSWELPLLKSWEQKTFIYNIAPTVAGNLIITPAHISYTIDSQYSDSSNSVNIISINTGKSCIRTIITPVPIQNHAKSEIIAPTQTSEVQRIVYTPIQTLIEPTPINTPIPETSGFMGIEVVGILLIIIRRGRL